MDIQFYGANCMAITSQGVRVVVDDNLSDLGAKSVTKAGDVTLFTGAHATIDAEVKLMIDIPGEYEVAGFSIYGIPARGHLDEGKQQSAIMYKIVANELSVLATGHIFPDLTDRELERIGMVDVLMIPVGGNGYTLDPVGALGIIKKIEPKLVIPTNYEQKGLNYPVPQQTLEQAVKGLAMEPTQTTARLKLKQADLTDTLQLVVIERA